MFFSCTALDRDRKIYTQLKAAPNLLPLITTPLLYNPRQDWPTLMLIMGLELRDRMAEWLMLRSQIEGTNAKLNPSLELLCVAFWLNDQPFLTELCANNHCTLTEYLVSRSNETDVLGNTLWHFANWGIGATFIANARAKNLIANKKELKNLPARIPPLVRDARVMKLHAVLYSADHNEFMQQARIAIHHDRCYYELGKSGCFHGMMLLLAAGFFEPIADLALAALKLFNHSIPGMTAFDFWGVLESLPRANGITQQRAVTWRHSTAETVNTDSNLDLANGTIPATNSLTLLNYLTNNAEIPELCLAFLVYQLRNDSPFEHPVIEDGIESRSVLNDSKHYYAYCLNEFLRNCLQKPQPGLIEVLFFCGRQILALLKPEVEQLAVAQARVYYPDVSAAIFTANAAAASTVALQAPAP